MTAFSKIAFPLSVEGRPPADRIRMQIRFAPVTLTLILTRWPYCTNMTWRFWRHTRIPKLNFLGLW